MVPYSISIIVIAMAMVRSAVTQHSDEDQQNQSSDRICYALQDMANTAEVGYGKDCTFLKDALKAGLGSILFPRKKNHHGNHDNRDDDHGRAGPGPRFEPIERWCYELQKVRDNYIRDGKNTDHVLQQRDVLQYIRNLGCDELKQMEEKEHKSFVGNAMLRPQ